ncbi:MAG: EamA family transporter RarD [Caulobacteraceae bacterium]|nr:EamA family transporter RarD [Caulobacter sp.]RYF93369.1 MAG: EamA family transporter RarD [Caulobacteraceae bacterium]
MLAGLAAYGFWGFLPLYFHLLGNLGVGTAEMIAHRTLWAVFWALGLVWLSRQGGEVRRVLTEPRTLGLLALSTLAILINWTIYVVAVNHQKVIEASLGYYINPLLNMAVGALFFRERMPLSGKIAIALATVGVGVQTIALGHLPLISLGLGISFCAYGVIRKQVKADAQTGLFFECAYLALPGLAYVLWLQSTGAGHFLTGWSLALLLMAAGPATVIPLALFAWSARRLSLTALGFLQFVAPTLQFFVGLALGEVFTPMRALSFGFIWAGVAVFAWGAWRMSRRAVVAAVE